MATPSFILKLTDPATWADPTAGKAALGVNEQGKLCLRQSDGTVEVIPTSSSGLPSQNKQIAVAGVVTVEPATPFHTERVQVGGVARVVPVLVAIDALGVVDGARLWLLLELPDAVGFSVQVFTGATLLVQLDNPDGSIRRATVELCYDDDAGAWFVDKVANPSYTPEA